MSKSDVIPCPVCGSKKIGERTEKKYHLCRRCNGSMIRRIGKLNRWFQHFYFGVDYKYLPQEKICECVEKLRRLVSEEEFVRYRKILQDSIDLHERSKETLATGNRLIDDILEAVKENA